MSEISYSRAPPGLWTTAVSPGLFPMRARATGEAMEVWGGNQPADSGVIMPGLDAWVYSRPHGEATAGGDVHYVSSCATGRGGQPRPTT